MKPKPMKILAKLFSIRFSNKPYKQKMSEMENILIHVITTHEDFLELLSYKYDIDIITEWEDFLMKRGIE